MMLENLIRVARNAMECLLNDRERLTIHEKEDSSGHKEPVTSKDLEVEALICEQLRAIDKDAGFLAEESSPTGNLRNKRRCFIIDPIDGTSEYLKGNPNYAVSIAVAEYGRLESGILAFPSSGRMVGAVRGHGIWEEKCRHVDRQKKSIRLAVSPKEQHSRVLVELAGKLNAQLIVIPSFTSKALAVLEGQCDAACFLSVSSTLKIWDYAASALILDEEGLSFTGLSGEILLNELPIVHRTGWIMGSEKLTERICEEIKRSHSSFSG